jgi:hypothetical protein
MSAPTVPFRRRVEESFLDGVRDQLAAIGVTEETLPMFAAGGDVATDTEFFLVVACMQNDEAAHGSGMYYADIRLSLCCSIGLKTSEQHDQLVAAVGHALSQMPKRAYGDDVRFSGWEVVDEQRATEDQTHGDVWFIKAGVLDLLNL